MAHSKAMLRVLKARGEVARKDPWFADVIYNVPIIETEEIKTMDTNGICVRFSPKFVEEHDDTIEGVFCHEGWHIILNHVKRRSTRDPRDWNIAADAVINPMVRRRGWSLPEGAIFLKETETGRMSVEKAYDWIKEQREKRAKTQKQPSQPQDSEDEDDLDKDADDLTEEGEDGDEEGESGGEPVEGEGEGGGGADDTPEDAGVDIPDSPGSEDMKEPSQKELDDFRQKIERAIESATEKAEKENRMDPVVRRAISDHKVERVMGYKEIIEDMIANNRAEDNRTWSRPNRRYLGNGEIRPGYLRDKINRLVVLYDTSGSIHAQATAEMREWTARMLEGGDITHITMISTDTEIRAIGDISTADEVRNFNLNIRSGGTYFEDAMKRVGEIDDAVGAVFLTDMQTSSFGPDPGIPVVWVNWSRPVKPGEVYWPPYGRVVDYKPEA